MLMVRDVGSATGGWWVRPFRAKVPDDGQSGVCIEGDVIGASAVAVVGSSAPGGGSGWVLLVGHRVVRSITKSVYLRGLRVCRV